VSAEPEASATYRRIYAVVKRIPRGKVATYGQVAILAGLPGHARQVGYALHALSEASGAKVPWHRVINAQGKISLREGWELQRAKLEAERVRFRGDKIDLARFGWGPGDARKQ
jgi:methylated-DNA-protein-cysteine methyltransferase-like protein